MIRVLYGVSSIGLGHATRAVAVAQELQDRGAEVTFATAGQAADFLSSYGLRVLRTARAPTPEVKGGEMVNPSLWYLRYWLSYRRGRGLVERMMTDVKPDVVVGDEEFAVLSVAVERGARSMMISDELTLGFARSRLARFVESRVERWYQELQRSVSMLVVPDFGEDREKIIYVSPIVRRVRRTREEVLSSLGIEGRRFILFSMSGSGIGSFLLEKAIDAYHESGLDAAFVVSGNRGPRIGGSGILDVGLQRDNQDLVAASDLVISTAGKSTIDEAASAGTPIIAIPIWKHAEQERNASSLGYGFSDVYRLKELIVSKFGRRSRPSAYEGARRTAELIVELSGSA